MDVLPFIVIVSLNLSCRFCCLFRVAVVAVAVAAVAAGGFAVIDAAVAAVIQHAARSSRFHVGVSLLLGGGVYCEVAEAENGLMTYILLLFSLPISLVVSVFVAVFAVPVLLLLILHSALIVAVGFTFDTPVVAVIAAVDCDLL